MITMKSSENSGYSRFLLRHYFDQLQQVTSSFIDTLRLIPLCDTRIFSLPDILREQENQPHPSYIPVHTICDHKQALSLACKAYSHFWMQENADISTRHPSRLPGVLVFERTEIRSLLHELALEINKLKNLFEQQAQSIPAESRFTELHDMMPGLMTLQVYRKIFISDESFYSVRFFWANKQYIQKVTKNEIIQRLKNSKQNPGRQFLNAEDFDAWQDAVEQEIEIVMAVSDSAELRIRRPIKVQPMARLTQSKHPEKQSSSVKQIAAPLPIILFRSDEHLRIGTLKNYNADSISHKRIPSPPKVELLIDRLHLYKLL